MVKGSTLFGFGMKWINIKKRRKEIDYLHIGIIP